MSHALGTIYTLLIYTTEAEAHKISQAIGTIKSIKKTAQNTLELEQYIGIIHILDLINMA